MKPTHVVCLFALAGAVTAQTASRPAGAKDAAPATKPKPRIEDLRRPVGNDTLKLNAQVQVRLRNGERVRGLVKSGKFVERPDGLGFADAERKSAGAGIRIWYYDNTNSYIFIEYEHIESCSVIRRLSDVEVREISDKMENQAKADRERLAQIDAARLQALKDRADGQKKDQELGKKLDDLTKKEEEAEKLKKLREKAEVLLKEFPPEEGWGPEKLRDIQVKKVAVGVFPDAKSRKFVEVYEDWKAAFDLKKKEDAEKAKAGEPKGDGRQPADSRPAGEAGTEAPPAAGTGNGTPESGEAQTTPPAKTKAKR